MDFYLLVVSGVSTLSFCGGEAKRIREGWIPRGRAAEFSVVADTHSPTQNRGKRIMKTIRRLPTRLVLETEARLILQRLWYRLGRRQDTYKFEQPLRSRDAPRT